MNNIKNELSNIADAGFKTIQLSPMQPQKDLSGGNWRGQWWKLYQPYGFKVAGNNENILGNKNDLKALTSAAEEKGIKIIVDVVTNHLAGGSENSFDGNVRNFEQTIYDNNLLHALGRYADDNDTESIVRGNIGGYPDLKTENTTVQNRVISMLEEYIDCGVKGFRFDAAKHIETDEDGNYASNYWSNVLSSIRSYGKDKLGEEPYIYGEILNTPGTHRSWGAYTKQMSVVDNTQGTRVLEAVKNKNMGNLTNTSFTAGNANKIVAWAESHDTYSNDNRETTDISKTIINKAYMIQASRKDAASLYFVRPNDGSNMGDIGSTDYKSNYIKAINKFHNFFVDGSEALSTSDKVFVNVRKKNALMGAALINCDDSSNATVTVDLPDGTYKDLVSNKSYTVSSKKVSVSFTSGACVLINNESGDESAASLSIEPAKTVFADKTSVTVRASNVDSAYYQINGGGAYEFKDQATFEVGEGLEDGDIEIKVIGITSNGTKSIKQTLTKTSLLNKNLIIKNVPTTENIFIWCWPTGQSGAWFNLEKQGTIRATDLPHDNFIIVKFESSVSFKEADWSKSKGQTNDLKLTDQIIDFSELAFK